MFKNDSLHHYQGLSFISPYLKISSPTLRLLLMAECSRDKAAQLREPGMDGKSRPGIGLSFNSLGPKCNDPGISITNLFY